MKTAPRPLRYLLVSAACAGLHLGVMIGGDRLGAHYAVSGLISYGLVVVAGYALHVRVTFAERPSRRGFSRYAAAMAANYPLTLLLMFLLCDVAGVPVPLAAPVVTALMTVWNYLASRWAVSGRGATVLPA